MILLISPFKEGWGSGIVNNSGTTGADSISVPFFLLDSAGNIHAIASGDSVFLWVFYPEGTLAYEDSGAFDDGKITAKTRHGFSAYSWQEAVADIDGASPAQGVYSYILTVKDLTDAALFTPHAGTFQLITETDFNLTLEYVKDVLDTVQLYDGRYALAAELTKAIDSVNAILDTLQLYDGRYALASELTNAIDSVNAILDTLQLYDGRYALASELTNAIDSINGILDTLQLYDDWIAKEATVQVIDDSVDVYDTRFDSLLAALADASIGDKAWTDGSFAARTNAAKATNCLDSLQKHDDWVAKEATIVAEIDTLRIYAGFQASGKTHTDYGTDADTITVVSSGGDSLAVIIYYHPGGSSGDPPDSVKNTAL